MKYYHVYCGNIIPRSNLLSDISATIFLECCNKLCTSKLLWNIEVLHIKAWLKFSNFVSLQDASKAIDDVRISIQSTTNNLCKSIIMAWLEMHVVSRMLGKGGKVIMKRESHFSIHGGRTQINPDPYHRVGSACTLDVFPKLISEHLSKSWTSPQIKEGTRYVLTLRRWADSWADRFGPYLQGD